jgi:hypothetical protein
MRHQKCKVTIDSAHAERPTCSLAVAECVPLGLRVWIRGRPIAFLKKAQAECCWLIGLGSLLLSHLIFKKEEN